MQRARYRTLCRTCNNLCDKEACGVHVCVHEKTDTNPGRDTQPSDITGCLQEGDLIGKKCNGNFLLDTQLVLLKVILYECINYSKYKSNLPVKKLI